MSNSVSEREFLERHSGLVYNLALRLTGNPSDAEDLAQDALLRALKGLGTFRGECAASTWAYRITVNAWKNRVRSEKRRGFWKMLPISLFTQEDRENGLALKSPEPAPDAALEAGERESLVQKALMELDEESRAILVLREIQGQSYQDIARALEIPEGTVKSRLWRARLALKESLRAQAPL
ncbi:MAG: sigma-70 family RNA polymerase sigma factor [Elusimicrobia bacterium]|nr:sigma-70 family RNA polymerase sigma factor [Elusimicrobiota bacterium]